MEWWGYLLTATALWLAGYMAGYGNGKTAGLSQLVGLSALARQNPQALTALRGAANAAQEHQTQRN